MKAFHWFLVTTLLVLSGCAATSMQGTWKDPDYRGGKIKSVFIIGVARDDFVRRLFEDDFNRQLGARGVKGISSYKHLGDPEAESREAAVAKVKQLGTESVVVTKVLGSRTDTVVTPARTSYSGGSPYYPRHHRSNWNDYYRNSYQVTHTPATVTDFQVYTIETNLYGADGTLIWSAQSETIAGGQREATIKEFIGLVIKDMASQGLL